MVQSQCEQARDVVIFDGVEDLPARLARADEMHLTQPAQLMRDSGLSHAEPFGEGADAHFPVHELGNDADAAGIAEGAEEFGKLDGFEFVEFHNI